MRVGFWWSWCVLNSHSPVIRYNTAWCVSILFPICCGKKGRLFLFLIFHTERGIYAILTDVFFHLGSSFAATAEKEILENSEESDSSFHFRGGGSSSARFGQLVVIGKSRQPIERVHGGQCCTAATPFRIFKPAKGETSGIHAF